MSDDSEKETKSSSLTTRDPWMPTRGPLSGVAANLTPFVSNFQATDAEAGALHNLFQNTQNAGQFTPAVTDLAHTLLGGGPDRTGMVQGTLDEFRGGLLPYATGSTNPYENADFRRMLDDTTSRAMTAVKNSYSGAGIPAAAFGDFGKRVGEGITSAIAPLAYQASNDLTNRKLNAINALFAGGNTSAGLLSGLDQTALGNRQAGVDAARSALQLLDAPYMRQLEIEAQRRGIPLQNLAQVSSLLIPMAQLGGTSSTQSESKSWSNPSLMESVGGWVDIGSKLFGPKGGTGGWGGF